MKKASFYLFLLLLSVLLIYGIAFSGDQQLGYHFRKQDISKRGDCKPIEEKGTHVAVSTRHTGPENHSGQYFLSMDLVSLKREVEMEVIFKNACENPTSPNFVAVFKIVLDEFTCFKKIKTFLDDVENEVEKYRRKYKLKGEVGFVEEDHMKKPDGFDQHSDNFISNLLPKRISWNISSDLSSNYLKGDVNLGNHFFIEVNWGSDSDVRAMFTFPL